jgi:bacterioferritin-associated ferredoxin
LLVCHCHRVCDRVIRECVEDGARSLDDIGRACGAGTACGGCQPTIGALLAGEPADAGVISLGRGRAHRAAAVVSADSGTNADSDTDADDRVLTRVSAYGNV